MPTTMSRRAILSAAILLAMSGAVSAHQDHARPAHPRDRIQFADADRCRSGSAFAIQNRTGEDILEVYIRLSGSTGWGEDRLGEGVVSAGRSLEFDPGQGVWDVLLVRADGAVFSAMRQNACRISTITLAATGITVR